MKITKNELKQIIKEELLAVLNEDNDWYDSERGHETIGDRKWADDPDNPNYEEPDTDDEDAEEPEANRPSIGDTPYEKTLSDYKKHPEWFN